MSLVAKAGSFPDPNKEGREPSNVEPLKRLCGDAGILEKKLGDEEVYV